MVFRSPFALSLKGAFLHLWGLEGCCAPLSPMQFGDTRNLVCKTRYRGLVLLALVALKRGRTLHLNQSYKALEDVRVPVSKLLQVVLPVGKGVKFGVQKVNDGQDICRRDASVGNGKNFAKRSQGQEAAFIQGAQSISGRGM